MPKQQSTATDANATAINSLVTKVRMEQAEQQYRLANYFTPYNFDPEQADFDRINALIEKHGNELTQKVFGSASPQLQERVDYALNEIVQRQASLEALLAMGAEVAATDEQLYQHAYERVVMGGRATQQTRMAGVR